MKIRSEFLDSGRIFCLSGSNCAILSVMNEKRRFGGRDESNFSGY